MELRSTEWLDAVRAQSAQSSQRKLDGERGMRTTPRGPPTSVHSALLAGHTPPPPRSTTTSPAPALNLLIDCVLKRPTDGPDEFFRLPFVNDFLLDLLLLTPSEQIRYWTEEHLLRLSFEAVEGTVGGVVYWTCCSRRTCRCGRPAARCAAPLDACWNSAPKYFSLRSKLMESLTDDDLLLLQPSGAQMLDDECNWVLNFNCSTDPPRRRYGLETSSPVTCR